MFASNQNNTLCMHVITKIAFTWSIKIYLHLENANMARNEGTLVGLEKKKQFQFNYRKRINGVKLIRKGSKHQAIVRRDVKGKIQPFNPNLHESLMTRKKDGEKEEGKIQCNFLCSPNKPFDPNLHEIPMPTKKDGKKGEGKIQCDFWYSPDGKILPNSQGITISYFFSLKAVYFCRHLRDHRRDYLWLAVT